jgi:hypothetical protein
MLTTTMLVQVNMVMLIIVPINQDGDDNDALTFPKLE